MNLTAEQSSVKQQIIEIRERDTRKFSVAGVAYRGTAAAIAKQLESERETFDWFVDEVRPDEEPAISAGQLNAFRVLRQKYPASQEAEHCLQLISESKLPPSPEFISAVQREKRLQTTTNAQQNRLCSDAGKLLTGSASASIQQIELALNAFLKHFASLRTGAAAWQTSALRDILAGNFATWNELFRRSQELIRGLAERAATADRCEASLPEVHQREIESGAQRLLEYLEQGKSLGFGPFRSKIVRECRQIWQNTRVNGKKCDTPENLRELLEYLSTLRTIDTLWKYWAQYVKRTSSPLSVQVATLTERAVWLKRCLRNHPLSAGSNDGRRKCTRPAFAKLARPQ